MTGSTRREKNKGRAENELFTCMVNGDGTVTVQNESYVDAKNHQYKVTLRDGFVSDCECPHRQHRSERCKHMITVKNEVVPSLPNDYGVNNHNDANNDIETIKLTASERRDIRTALTNEMVDALTAGCDADSERLRQLRKRFLK